MNDERFVQRINSARSEGAVEFDVEGAEPVDFGPAVACRGDESVVFEIEGDEVGFTDTEMRGLLSKLVNDDGDSIADGAGRRGFNHVTPTRYAIYRFAGSEEVVYFEIERTEFLGKVRAWLYE